MHYSVTLLRDPGQTLEPCTDPIPRALEMAAPLGEGGLHADTQGSVVAPVQSARTQGHWVQHCAFNCRKQTKIIQLITCQ